MLSFTKSPTAAVGDDIYHRTTLQKLPYAADPCTFQRDPEVQLKKLIYLDSCALALVSQP